MPSISDTAIRGIRTKPWYRNEGNIPIDQAVIEETVRKLHLTKCPVCRGELKSKDNFGTYLPRKRTLEEGYCPQDNYIVQLEAHKYEGNTSGTTLYMKIFTNARQSVLLADSGELADLSTQEELLGF
jgi:predicted anti-sigma-YlaC factor YlaD